MRVADLDELCKEMKEVFEEIEVSDDFKKGFSYAMNIVQRKRGIKIPKAKADGPIHASILELRSDAE